MRSITKQFDDVVKYTPVLEVEFRKKKKAVGTCWRMDETSIKVKGKWRYFYRAVDKEGKTIDFLLTKNRDKLAAKRFLLKAIDNNGQRRISPYKV